MNKQQTSSCMVCPFKLKCYPQAGKQKVTNPERTETWKAVEHPNQLYKRE